VSGCRPEITFSIGEFAQHGRVSVRMLRHYDAIGLLRPACVVPASGYRLYEASQLADLNRIIALKDLGFTLQQVQAVLDEKVPVAELRGMLKLRRRRSMLRSMPTLLGWPGSRPACGQSKRRKARRLMASSSSAWRPSVWVS
jgi:DNA-binding transcriptional MerR regulator